MIGDVGYVWSSLWFNRFAKKYDVKQEFIYSPEKKVKFNPFEEIKPESEKWAQNLVFGMEHELKVAITNNRVEHFTKKGVWFG
jgi:ClpP class serine protease